MQTLTIGAYAERHGKSYRTVQRWLEQGLLPGAERTRAGWTIPADVLPLPAEAAPAAAIATTAQSRKVFTLGEYLDRQPAYLDVDTAAQLLGITAYAVRQHAERYAGEHVGPNGALMIPQSAVRQVAGL
jgi:hypothetical protein